MPELILIVDDACRITLTLEGRALGMELRCLDGRLHAVEVQDSAAAAPLFVGFGWVDYCQLAETPPAPDHTVTKSD